jgi:hypothetical protein
MGLSALRVFVSGSLDPQLLYLQRRPSLTRCYTKDARTMTCLPNQETSQGTIILEDIGNGGYQTRFLLLAAWTAAPCVQAIASSFKTVIVSLLYKAYHIV